MPKELPGSREPSLGRRRGNQTPQLSPSCSNRQKSEFPLSSVPGARVVLPWMSDYRAQPFDHRIAVPSFLFYPRSTEGKS